MKNLLSSRESKIYHFHTLSNSERTMPSLRKPLTRLLKSQKDSNQEEETTDESKLLQFNQLKQVTLNHHYHHHKHQLRKLYNLQLQLHQLSKLYHLQ